VSATESDESSGRKFDLVHTTLMSWLSDGTYRVGSSLPAQREIAAALGVSRDTVRNVVRTMTEDGYLSTTQGRGVTVVKSPELESAPRGRPQLYHFMHDAFRQAEVSLDVLALTAESFVGHFELHVGRVEAGELALRKVSVRMLLPSEDGELAYPRAWNPEDDRPWLRWRTMTRGNARKMERCRDRLTDYGVTLDLRINRVKLTPAFKLYVINGSDLLHGWYHPVTGPMNLEDGSIVDGAVERKCVGASLHHYRAGTEEFARYREYFQNHWDLAEQSEE
jgi:DNA-binding transcriptional regulator YhcF (GntR family)